MSVFRDSIHIITKHLSYWALFIAVIFTILVAALYWVSDAIEQRQNEISQWIGDELGYPVTIEHAGLNWVGIEPKLQIESLTVFQNDGRTKIFSFGQLYFGLDLVASIKQQDPIFNDIAISDLNFAVVRDSKGKVNIDGFNNSQKSNTSESNMDWLSWARIFNSFTLNGSTVTYTDLQQDELSGNYKFKNISVEHEDGQWQLAGNIGLPIHLGNKLQFQAQGKLENDDIKKTAWQWQADVDEIKLEPLSAQLAWQDIALQQGVVKAHWSGSAIGNYIDSIKANIELSQIRVASLRTDKKLRPVLIDNLSGDFSWQQRDQLWQMNGENIQLSVNGETWPETDFLIDKHNNEWTVASKYIRLSDLTTIASLTEYSPENLRQQKPAGDIEKFRFQYSQQNGVTFLAFDLQDGAFLPWQKYPGITGLTASVNWQNDSVSVDLNSHQVTIDPETWLDKAVFFDSITGTLQLEKKEATWALQSQEFRAWNDDLTLQLDGSIAQQADGKIINDLILHLEEVIVNQWQKYVPQKNFNTSFRSWINKAFPAGKIIDGDIIWQGELAAFPYEKEPEKGQFNMELQVENVQLHYADGWPDLFDIKAVITGSGNDLIIKSKYGNVAGFDFANVITTISKLTESGPLLFAEADIKGTTENAVQFLLDSPLKERFGKAVQTVRAAGLSDIHLELHVPLADVEETQASGMVSFVDSALYEKSLSEVGVTKINGELQYTNTGVTAENITAQLFNQAISVDVKPKNDETVVSVISNIKVADVSAIWPDSVLDFVSGAIDYKVDIMVAEREVGDFYIDVELSSDLNGLQVDMPQPIGKNRDEKRSLKATFDHVDDGLAYALSYGKQFNAIVMNKTDLWRGELRFGVGKAQIPKQGIRVRGQIPELSVDDWLDWTRKQTGTDGPLFASLDDISVEIGLLTGFEQQLSKLNVSAQKDAQGWRTNIRSEQTKGTVYIPSDFDNNAIFKVDLDKVTLTLPKNDSTNDEVETTSSTNLWPAVDINIGSLIVNEMVLGQLNAQAHRKPQSWLLDSATLTSDVFTASLSKGEWQQSISDNRSRVYIQAESKNVAALLENFDYQQAFEAENIQLTMDLSWLDTPLEFSRHNVEGLLTIDIGKGKLKEIEPGAAGRIFGLLSVAAIPKRLSLDFSDLFGEGFSFDSIIGSFNLANGLATTENLTLKGAPATIEMTGPIDLVNKRYNQKVKIRPNVASTLPLAGAVAGGPIGLAAGAAIMLFDKVAGSLLGTEIVNIISYSYDLTGSWDDPQMNVAKPESP